MNTVILKYDTHDLRATQVLDYILSSGVFEKTGHNIYSSVNNFAPEGYMTSEEFRKRAVFKANTFCDKHGIL